MKLTRHNGRSGKHGTYNPRHNDRRFDVENSEHIDAERARQNVYWDCYRGFTTHDFRENPEQPDFSFEEIERMYYYEHYADHVNAQNARNEKTRHIERNRTVDDLLKNNKTCPEESIYQIGTMEESVPPETLALIVSEFYEEFENRFGSHIHILDWALHLDEGTPHIHERHVFDCENRYGELCPQQEKALEELGIPLPKPEQPKGKHNNRKQTFDAVCRTILFDIAKRHGLHLEQEPSYGGRDYLEKQDYILMKQKEQLATQEQKLEELTLKIEDVETLLEDVSGAAYGKAVEVVTDKVREQTQLEDMEVIEKYRKSVVSPNAKNSPEVVKIANTLPVSYTHLDVYKRQGQSEASTAPPTAFHLPLHNRTADRAIQYLTESRGLNKTLVEAFLLSGDIYEDAKRHNVVFVGRDRSGTPRYAHVRGTADPFRQDIAGSDKSYPFHYEGNGNQLFVFEAPIDLLSFICLYPQDWQKRNYLALGGVSGKALDRFLSERKDTRKVFLCLDSDTAGSEACTRLAQEDVYKRQVYRPHRRSRFTSILLGDSFPRRLEKWSLPRRN